MGVKGKLCIMINLPPSEKVSSSRQAEASEFQASYSLRWLCFIWREVCACLCPVWIIFLEPIYVFLLKGEVLSLGGWWKAFKPLCFEHQTACLKIYCEWGVKSSEWGEEERDTDVRSARQGVKWVILKFSCRAALQAQIRTILKCHGSFVKKLNLPQKGQFRHAEWII